MENNNEVEEEKTTSWFTDKPAATIVVAAVFVFPFVLAYWGLVKMTKASMMASMNRRFMKKFGRTMTGIEEVLYKMDLDKKFGI